MCILGARLPLRGLYTKETIRSVIAKEPKATAAISGAANEPRGPFLESETAAVAPMSRGSLAVTMRSVFSKN